MCAVEAPSLAWYICTHPRVQAHMPSFWCTDWAAVFLSECVLAMRGYSTTPRNNAADMNEVMDRIAARHVALELQDRRCIAEARRNQTANRMLFRSKMLEHRRIQAQMVQLQRYRESALAHLDAVSNHEINQTFMRAIRGTEIKTKDVTSAVDELHESMNSVREISELLGQPLPGIAEEISDEDLESEFMEFSTSAALTEPPEVSLPLLKKNESVSPPAVIELRTAVFERC